MTGPEATAADDEGGGTPAKSYHPPDFGHIPEFVPHSRGSYWSTVGCPRTDLSVRGRDGDIVVGSGHHLPQEGLDETVMSAAQPSEPSRRQKRNWQLKSFLTGRSRAVKRTGCHRAAVHFADFLLRRHRDVHRLAKTICRSLIQQKKQHKKKQQKTKPSGLNSTCSFFVQRDQAY